MSEAAGFLDDLRASRERLLAVVAGVSEEQFKRRPMPEAEAAAGTWSIAEVLGHLLAAEQRAGTRIEALLAGRQPDETSPSDEERDAEARLGRTVPVPQIIHGLLAARRRLERVLSERTAVTPAAIAMLREDVIEHEAAHTAQIEAVKVALATAKATRG